jgi:hypothetical protein
MRDITADEHIGTGYLKNMISMNVYTGHMYVTGDTRV